MKRRPCRQSVSRHGHLGVSFQYMENWFAWDSLHCDKETVWSIGGYKHREVMQSTDLSLQVASLLSRYVEEGKSKQQDNTCSLICSRVLSLNDFSIVWKLQTAHPQFRWLWGQRWRWIPRGCCLAVHASRLSVDLCMVDVVANDSKCIWAYEAVTSHCPERAPALSSAHFCSVNQTVRRWRNIFSGEDFAPAVLFDHECQTRRGLSTSVDPLWLHSENFIF